MVVDETGMRDLVKDVEVTPVEHLLDQRVVDTAIKRCLCDRIGPAGGFDFERGMLLCLLAIVQALGTRPSCCMMASSSLM
jgi:hypothetical protein